ncbi:MAG TPA: hypothetical protein VE218_15145 [Acidobacteriaceae bacterium]|nr:hypothetical protein [Acidobacteriaceae bacterium]
MKLRSHCLLAGVAVLSLAAGGFTPVAAQLSGSGTGLRHGPPDKAAMSYVTRCLGVAPLRPVELYARGGWYVTADLRDQLREREGDIEGIAMVWKLKNLPRAVYQWNHDGEFNRDVVACLDAGGKVTRSESRYTPGDSEPNQHWVYIHTLSSNAHHGKLVGSGRFTDRQGNPRGTPQLTSEDQDFIAGERVYHTWTDFDFAGLVGTQER